VRDLVEASWPSTSAGGLVACEIGHAGGRLLLRVLHVGEALTEMAKETLQRALASALGRPVELLDVPLPASPRAPATSEDPLVFATELSATLRDVAPYRELRVCVTSPRAAPARPRHRAAPMDPLSIPVSSIIASHSRVTHLEGEGWSFYVSRGPCPDASVVSLTAGP
jgi:hypothetical protein